MFEMLMVFVFGFLVLFVFGGLIGVIFVVLLLDFYFSDLYFVVVYFYYVVFGIVVFVMFVGFYFWWLKWMGCMFNECFGYVYFWMLFIGFYMMFFIQYWLGVDGMVCCYVDYFVVDGWMWQNQVFMIGVIIFGVLMLLFFLNVWIMVCKVLKVMVNDLWGYGVLFEWVMFCLLFCYNFMLILCICSECFVFDLNYLEVVEFVMIVFGE